MGRIFFPSTLRIVFVTRSGIDASLLEPSSASFRKPETIFLRL